MLGSGQGPFLSSCLEPSSPSVRQFGSGFHSNRPNTYPLSRVPNSTLVLRPFASPATPRRSSRSANIKPETPEITSGMLSSFTTSPMRDETAKELAVVYILSFIFILCLHNGLLVTFCDYLMKNSLRVGFLLGRSSCNIRRKSGDGLGFSAVPINLSYENEGRRTGERGRKQKSSGEESEKKLIRGSIRGHTMAVT